MNTEENTQIIDVIVTKEQWQHYLPIIIKYQMLMDEIILLHWKWFYLYLIVFSWWIQIPLVKKGSEYTHFFEKKSIRVKVAQVLGCTYSDYIPRSVVVFKWCVCKQNFGYHIATPSRVHTVAYYILYTVYTYLLCAMHFVYLISLGHIVG